MTNSKDVTPSPSRQAKPALDPLDPHSEIARRLRNLYCEIEQEPIPDELIALLEKLDTAEAKGNR